MPNTIYYQCGNQVLTTECCDFLGKCCDFLGESLDTYCDFYGTVATFTALMTIAPGSRRHPLRQGAQHG